MSEKKILVVIDMQNDFLTGSLGIKEPESVINSVCARIRSWPGSGEIFLTQDTHTDGYLSSREGRQIPVPHCIKDTDGWKIQRDVIQTLQARSNDIRIVEKPTFGSTELAELIRDCNPSYIELVGVCTDICVLSNAVLLRSSFPETDIAVDAAACRGSSTEAHNKALELMQGLGIRILNRQ